MEDNKDYFKVTIDSKNFQQYNRNTEHFEPRMDASTLSRAENLLKSFERAIQSATNSFDGFQSSLKRIATRDDLSNPRDPVYSGRFQQSFYVQAKELDNVIKALKAQNASLVGSGKIAQSIGDAGFDISSSAAREITRYKTLKGREAVNLAREGLSNINGRLEHVPTAKNPDRYRVSVLMGENEYASMTEGLTGGKVTGAVTRYINEAIRPANRMSNYTAREEKARQEAQEQARLEKERAKREKEKEKADREQAKEEARNTKSMVKLGRAMLAGITLATVLLRKLGSTFLQNATETFQNTVVGTPISLNASEVRRLNTISKAHGMDESSLVSAVTSVQESFGDILHLDEGKLTDLAPYLGGDVAALVKHGIGEGDPLGLTQMILDDYFSAYLKDKGSAEKIITNLQKSMPQLATILTQMIAEEQMPTYKDEPFRNTEEWMYGTASLAQIAQKGATDESYQQVIGKNWAVVLAKLNNQIDAILSDFNDSFARFVDAVKSNTIGLDEATKHATRIAARTLNSNRALALEGRIAGINATYLGPLNKKLGKKPGEEYTDIRQMSAGELSSLYSDASNMSLIQAYFFATNAKAAAETLYAENLNGAKAIARDTEFSDAAIMSTVNRRVAETALSIAMNNLNVGITEEDISNAPSTMAQDVLKNRKKTAGDKVYPLDYASIAIEEIDSLLTTSGGNTKFKNSLALAALAEEFANLPGAERDYATVTVEGTGVNFVYSWAVKSFQKWFEKLKKKPEEINRILNNKVNTSGGALFKYGTKGDDLIDALWGGAAESSEFTKDILGNSVSFLDSAYGNNYFGGLVSPFSGSPLAFGGQSAGGAQERVLKVQFADSNGSIIAQKTISFAENETEAFPDSVKLDLSNIIG